MDWSELVGTKVQLPPPGNELSQSNGQLPAAEPPLAAAAAPAPAPAPAKTSRTAKAAAANRENPLFAGSAADPAETATAAPPPAAPAAVRVTTVSSLLTVPTLMNLTFATTVITLLWKLLQRWFGVAAGQWVPLVCCLVFVGISWVASYATARTNAVTKVVTLLVAVLTAFILTAAVIGIDVAILRPNG